MTTAEQVTEAVRLDQGSFVASADDRSIKLFAALAAQLADRLRILSDKPEETVDTTLRALWHLAAGNALSTDAASESALPTLSAEAEDRLRGLLSLRAGGTPLAHLTGRQRFMGLELLAGKDALIPRRETELLGNAALRLLREIAERGEHPLVVDICTGSGNLASSLAHFVPSARVYAADLSMDAVSLARRNLEWLKLTDRAEVRQGDLLEPFESELFWESVDLLVCNPPYISSKRVEAMPGEIAEFEPRLAFDGGPLGVRILNRLIREAPRFLRKGGWLAFEVGLGQGRAVLQRLNIGGEYSDVETVLDTSGDVRAIIARRRQ
jgi:release factor glutamine methyltransferase